MKKIITITVAVAMAAGLYGCGCDKKQDGGSHIVDGKPVVATTVPEAEETVAPTEAAGVSAAPSSGATVGNTTAGNATAGNATAGNSTVNSTDKEPMVTIEPIEDSVEVKDVEADEVPTSESEKDFEQTVVLDGYRRYVGGDDKWGIVLPPGAEIGDEAEEGSLFIINENIVTANIMDKEVRLESVADAKAYLADLGDIAIDEFTVIRDNGEYTGCFFEYLTEDGVRGFAKYVVQGRKTVCAAGVNSTADAQADAIMREVVNSLVIFK